MSDEVNLSETTSNEGRDWETEARIAQQRVDDLERQLEAKQYELALTGAMARLNVAGQILGGYAAAGHLPANAGESRNDAAMRWADVTVGDYERLMEQRASQWMAMRALSPNDNTPTTEN
jgi:hypothetical protein